MSSIRPLIGTGTLKRNSLAGQVAIVTGAGGGIGFEAARSLAWLGAKVIIAEISKGGKQAADRINREMGAGSAIYIRTDVGSERSVNRLADVALKKFGKVDIVLNNATVAILGAVKDLPIDAWDISYRVNLRGPVLLARKFLPGMIERDYGIFVAVTSEGLAYMGAYESLKAAQLHLARTIDAEVEGTGVVSFTIGPGMVPTATAQKGVQDLAKFYGKTLEEMQALTAPYMLSIEAAGAGFAAAVALAEQFRGREIGSKQALIAAGIDLAEESGDMPKPALGEKQLDQALLLCRRVRAILKEQSDGWLERSVFERQWMLRDFKRHAGMPVEQWLEALEKLEKHLAEKDVESIRRIETPVEKLVEFYGHLQDLARGYTKDQQKLEENLRIIQSWQDDAAKLTDILSV